MFPLPNHQVRQLDRWPCTSSWGQVCTGEKVELVETHSGEVARLEVQLRLTALGGGDAHRGVWLEAEVEEAGVAVQPELEGNNNATLKQMHQQTQVKDKDRKCKVKTCLMRRIYKIKQEIQNEKTKPREQGTSLTNLNQKTSMFSPLNTNISYFLLVRIKHLAGVASPMRNPIHLFLPAVSD